MSIYLVLLIIFLLLIIIFLIYKLTIISMSIKEIEISMNKILRVDSNRLITISTDNKEFKKLVNNLNKYLMELKKKERIYKNGNQELQNSIANISHDIKTPLTAIKGYIDLIKRDKISKKTQKYLKIIDERIDTLTFLTEQLFDYSKCLDLKDKIKKEKVCINDILENVLVSYYELFKEKNITPKISITEKKIIKFIDKNMFIRVLENILSNGLKYSDEDIRVKLLKSGKIIISNKSNFFDKTSIDSIFHRYYTLQTGKKTSGLGLAIAKQLIELNGGNINAKYEKNNLIIEIEISDI